MSGEDGQADKERGLYMSDRGSTGGRYAPICAQLTVSSLSGDLSRSTISPARWRTDCGGRPMPSGNCLAISSASPMSQREANNSE